jgi:hypothetical protein
MILSLLSLPKKMAGICYHQAMLNGSEWLVAEKSRTKKIIIFLYGILYNTDIGI